MCTLLQSAGANMKVIRTDFKSVAQTYACSVKIIIGVWKRGRDTMTQSDLLDVISKRKGKKDKYRIKTYAVHKKMEAARWPNTRSTASPYYAYCASLQISRNLTCFN